MKDYYIFNGVDPLIIKVRGDLESYDCVRSCDGCGALLYARQRGMSGCRVIKSNGFCYQLGIDAFDNMEEVKKMRLAYTKRLLKKHTREMLETKQIVDDLINDKFFMIVESFSESLPHG